MACDTSLDLQDDIDENLFEEILNNSDIVKALGHSEVTQNWIYSIPKVTQKTHSPPQDFSITQALEREKSDKKKFVYPHQVNINLKLVSNCFKNQHTESAEENAEIKRSADCYKNQTNNEKSWEKCGNHVGSSKDLTDINMSCNSKPISQPTSPILSSHRNRKKRKHATSSCVAGDDISVIPISTPAVGCHKNPNSPKPVQSVSNKISLPNRCSLNATYIDHSDVKTYLTPLSESNIKCFKTETPTKTKAQQRHFQIKTSFTPSGTEYNPWKNQESLSKRRRTFSGSCLAQTGNLIKLKTTAVTLKNTTGVMQTNITSKTIKQSETMSFSGGKSCQGFKTASNKDVKISSEAWNKAKDLMKSLDKPPSALSQTVSNASPIKVSKAAWSKIESLTSNNLNASRNTLDTASRGDDGTTVKHLNMPASHGFKTANNKDLKISNAAWNKAIQFMNNIDRPSNEYSQKVVKTSPITVSKASWSNAESTLLCKDQLLTNTKYCNVQTKKQPIVSTGEKTSCVFPQISNSCGFSTASNKAITVSNQAWTKAMQFMENESSPLSQNCGNIEGNLNHINSGGCKPITIPKEAWNRAKHVMSSYNENEMEKTDNIRVKSVVEKNCTLERKMLQPVGTAKSAHPNGITSPRSLRNLPVNNSDLECRLRTPTATVSTPGETNVLNKKTVLKSFPSAKRRNSAYKPPRSKRDKQQNHEPKKGPDVAKIVESGKENVVPSSLKPPACRSIGKRLGIKTNPETQIMMSDESLLLALELIENT